MTDKVNGNTKLGADLALKRRAISQESHATVLAGKLGLQEAKDLGKNAGPDGPVKPTSRISKDDRTPEPCMCGCGWRPKRPGSRWIPGHDQRAVRWANAVARGEDVGLTDEQREYIEQSGKLERAHRRIAEEDAKRTAKQSSEK